MRRALRALPFLFFVAFPGLGAAEPLEYVGRLEAGLEPDGGEGPAFDLERAPAELLERLPSRPGPEDKVFSNKLQILYDGTLEVQVVLVEPAQGKPFLYADMDMNGELSASERFGFGPWPGVPEEAGAVELRFPRSNGDFPFYPVLLTWSPPASGETPKEGVRRLRRSGQAYVLGTARVGDREVRVRYPVSSKTVRVDLGGGRVGMDLDGDGEIEPELSTGETQTPFEKTETLVFRLGDLYLSTKSVDVAAGKFVLRTHPASDHTRFDLRPGSRLSDFAFTDVDGKERRLSDLRGKVVLLDFWGTWCYACVKEMPTLLKAHETFRGRGFEILGLDFEDDLDTQKKFVAEKGLPWINATAVSAKPLIEKNFRVWVFPTKILLDREGRIVSLGEPGQPPLKDEGLLKSIEEVVGPPQEVPTSMR